MDMSRSTVKGGDRMCKELEAIGLPDPMFNDNTFILKTTVMSAFFEGKSTGEARRMERYLPRMQRMPGL